MEDIWGDECRRGADVHRWHIFATSVPSQSVTIDPDEGGEPLWLTLKEALGRSLTPAVRRIITQHGRSIHVATS